MNSIEKGSSIPISYESEKMSEKFFGMEKGRRNILLVEGVEDQALIRKYCLIHDKELQFEVLPPSIDGDRGDGKNKVLDKYKQDNLNNIICLIDRDYDFLFNENVDDPNIFYYDVYELENYLFEFDIFRRMCVYSLAGVNREQISFYYNSLKEYNEEEVYVYLFFINFFRELNYREKVREKLDENTAREFAQMCKQIKTKEILKGYLPEVKEKPFEVRVRCYLEHKVNEIESDLFARMVDEVGGYEKPTNLLEFLMHYYKGKQLIEFTRELLAETINLILPKHVELKTMLLCEWLPNSPLLSNKINDIADQFQKLQKVDSEYVLS